MGCGVARPVSAAGRPWRPGSDGLMRSRRPGLHAMLAPLCLLAQAENAGGEPSSMLDLVTAPFRYQFMCHGFITAILVGITCATLGSYVVLRQMAFVGDAMSH